MTSTVATPTTETTLLVDGHVHLHPCFDLSDFLAAALNNFCKQGQQMQAPAPITGALLLAEISGVNAFADIVTQQSSINQRMSDWEICSTQERFSLWAKHVDGHTILMTAGRQVVTAEGIEVLALITDATVEDGRSLSDTLTAIETTDGLPVLPWGVGKWIGKRGELVQAQLKNAEHDLLFAGDNGGRPRFWRLPKFFQHRPQIPGSDPLPLAKEVNRAGSFGFITRGKLDDNQPGASLKHLLRQTQPYIQPYGKSMSPIAFIKAQSLLRMQ